MATKSPEKIPSQSGTRRFIIDLPLDITPAIAEVAQRIGRTQTQLFTEAAILLLEEYCEGVPQSVRRGLAASIANSDRGPRKWNPARLSEDDAASAASRPSDAKRLPVKSSWRASSKDLRQVTANVSVELVKAVTTALDNRQIARREAMTRALVLLLEELGEPIPASISREMQVPLTEGRTSKPRGPRPTF